MDLYSVNHIFIQVCCHPGFYYVEICPLYTHFGKSFYHESMLNFFKCFFCIYWDGHVVFKFSFVNVVYYIDWFVYVEPSLWTWDEFNLIVVYDLFNVFFLFGLPIFVEEFCIHIHQKSWPVIFFGSVFAWFSYQGDSGFIEWLWECFLLFSL